MSRNAKKYLLLTILPLSVGLLVYLSYSCHRLVKERNGLAMELESEQNRFKVLQRKYSEQKAQTAALQRAKLAAEGGLRQAQQELATAQEEKDALSRELATVGEKTTALEERIVRYKEEFEKLVENRDQYKSKLAETVAIVKERNEMIYKLRAEKEDLTGNLQETSSTLNRCVKHNARLSKLAEELISAYENKGIGAALSQAEPFTQLKKVELEKLIQQYRDRIDNDNLELINQKKN